MAGNGFNPRARMRRDPAGFTQVPDDVFQSTRPYEARLRSLEIVRDTEVSIHAPV